VFWRGEEVADLPIKELGDAAPEYDRPWTLPAAPKPVGEVPEMDVADALLRLIGSPALSSRRWVYEQYDTWIQGNSLQLPGGDAGVIRVEGHPTKALAFSSDVTPRYCEADPFEGGKQAVAECWRNLTAVGADPIAATDNLNFGNPERPEIMGQLVHAIKGIGEACRALSFPIVSGNVSLYNETNGRGILPTPTIGGVGLMPDWSKMARIGFAEADHTILLIGGPDNRGSHLGQSIYLRDLFGRVEGPPPPVDLAAERTAGDFVRGLIRRGIATAVHDLSDGGLAVALAEMAMASGIGAKVSQLPDHSLAAQFFGEDQGRYVVTVNLEPNSTIAADLREEWRATGITAHMLGTTGGDTLILGDARPLAVSALREAHEGWFPTYMKGEIV
jgi:phosphoribosylformylglycinamidine synthase